MDRRPGDGMSQGIQFIDIIFLGLVAGFLVLRLRSVLGRRTGEEKERDLRGRSMEDVQASPSPREDNVIELPGRREGERPISFGAVDDAVEAGLTRISLADPAFEPDRFLGGARAAFEMIVEAFAKGDTAALRPLLADEVYKDFESAIRQRQEAGETMETEIEAIKSIDLTRAEMRGDTAYVTVRFVSEQMVLVKDGEGRVVAGDPTRYETVTDDWTFARNTTSRDPNWQLVATETPEDEGEEGSGTEA